MCRVRPPWTDDGPPEFLEQLGVEAGGARGQLRLQVEEGAVAQVHGDLGQGLVHGHPGFAVAPHAGTLQQGLADGVAQADADVLDGVVLVHLQVAAGLELQVEIAVGREQVQHVVQEGDAGIDLDVPRPSSSSSRSTSVSRVLRWTLLKGDMIILL